MQSYADEWKCKALKVVEGCGGSITRAMRCLSHPSRQTPYQWLNQEDTSHERKAGRP